MTGPAHRSDRPSPGQHELARLDYAAVRSYWSRARPSVLGPYMMDGFGIPMNAGRFRFRGERRVVDRLTAGVRSNASVLDLGSGVGFWTEHFARRFGRVVSVEASPVLYEALQQRCSRLSNVETCRTDVLSFVPPEGIDLVFLGGLLMYLNEADVGALITNLLAYMAPGAVIVCRESTVAYGTQLRQDDYHVVYRSPETYLRLFRDCGLSEITTRPNIPYIFAQMVCEVMKKWKALVPGKVQCLPVVGHLLYWASRLGYPWNAMFVPWAFGRMGVRFPALTNHFFLLQAAPRARAPGSDRIEEGCSP